jgi:uncharacterized membrane protein YqjE
MTPPSPGLAEVAATSKRIAQDVAAIGQNRFELLVVEAQEERDRLIRIALLLLGTATCGLLGGVTLTMAIVVLLWEHSPAAALLVMFAVYAIATVLLYSRTVQLQRGWKMLPATLDQLRKDRACLEQSLR